MNISPKRYARALAGALAEQHDSDRVIKKFIDMVASHHALDKVPAIIDAYRSISAEREGRVRITITTATPLPAAKQSAVAATLSQTLGSEVLLTAEHDARLIGGAVIAIGDTVYDGSIKRTLMDLKHSLAQHV